MAKKIYIQDILDNSTYKSILEDFACTDCGLVPHYELSKITNGFDIKINMKGWDRINNEVKCLQCLRKIKIIRINNKIINNI